ncbi:hypothetical protein HU200_024882 [Digitaria exilis]|uniref:Uncharacterized protein n=1 Tax=Digitaria exilis TaxID=1010633 RepID=A0A835C3Z6_9POAL|nr:hypothetical protein HU200_024882 [Digitaria exilis]
MPLMLRATPPVSTTHPPVPTGLETAGAWRCPVRSTRHRIRFENRVPIRLFLATHPASCWAAGRLAQASCRNGQNPDPSPPQIYTNTPRPPPICIFLASRLAFPLPRLFFSFFPSTRRLRLPRRSEEVLRIPSRPPPPLPTGDEIVIGRVGAMEGVNGAGGSECERKPLSEVVGDCVQRWFQDAFKEARKGDVANQVLVAQMFFSGYGVPKNEQKGGEALGILAEALPSEGGEEHPGRDERRPTCTWGITRPGSLCPCTGIPFERGFNNEDYDEEEEEEEEEEEDEDDESDNSLYEESKELIKKMERMLKRLNSKGVPITMQDVRMAQRGPTVSSLSQRLLLSRMPRGKIVFSHAI